MPHAALWVVQQVELDETMIANLVSMPHAALWVVQPQGRSTCSGLQRFNAARGFVGGAAPIKIVAMLVFVGFNAARGFVGGAAVLSLIM